MKTCYKFVLQIFDTADGFSSLKIATCLCQGPCSQVASPRFGSGVIRAVSIWMLLGVSPGRTGPHVRQPQAHYCKGRSARRAGGHPLVVLSGCATTPPQAARTPTAATPHLHERLQGYQLGSPHHQKDCMLQWYNAGSTASRGTLAQRRQQAPSANVKWRLFPCWYQQHSTHPRTLQGFIQKEL